MSGSELNGRKHSQNVIFSEFASLLKFAFVTAVPFSVDPLAVIYDLSFILMTRHQHLRTWVTMFTSTSRGNCVIPQ
jgi:hypothetical protein